MTQVPKHVRLRERENAEVRQFKTELDHLTKDHGYFECGDFQKFAPHTYYQFGSVSVSAGATVAYYAGSFGVFHAGHQSVVRSTIEHLQQTVSNEDFCLVIAPANADYAAQKYGINSPLASNKARYDHVRAFCDTLPDHTRSKVVIDLDPMLQYDRDINVTDQLENFLGSKNLSVFSMTNAPYIVAGKDVNCFNGLEFATNGLLRSLHFKDCTNASTSQDFKAVCTDNKKKILLLRGYYPQHAKVFRKYFSKYYRSIKFIDIHDEIEQVKKFQNFFGLYDFTVCKDYKDIVPYISVSRKWINPLHKCEQELSGELDKLVLMPYESHCVDSDVFSGTTRDILHSMGIILHTLTDTSGDEVYEILDLEDFLSLNYTYPHVDVSSRCSLPAFTTEMHKLFKEFLDELRATD